MNPTSGQSPTTPFLRDALTNNLSYYAVWAQGHQASWDEASRRYPRFDLAELIRKVAKIANI
jgi:hypothetical protein